jgi:hypothetical protein
VHKGHRTGWHYVLTWTKSATRPGPMAPLASSARLARFSAPELLPGPGDVSVPDAADGLELFLLRGPGETPKPLGVTLSGRRRRTPARSGSVLLPNRAPPVRSRCRFDKVATTGG